VAAEGGGAEAELPGQGAVGHPLDEAAVDLRAGGVRTDRTAWHHKWAPRKKFPQDAGWISGYQGRGGGASTDGTVGKEWGRKGEKGGQMEGVAELGPPGGSRVQLGNEGEKSPHKR